MAGIVRVFDNRPRGYVLDLEDLSSSTFYPVTMSPPGGMNYGGLAGLDCEIHSPSDTAAAAYNQNYITFRAQCDGWGDKKEMLTVREYGCYDANEITIGCIGFGTKNGPVCVWIRGGLKYGFYCNSTPELHTSTYTTSLGEVFTTGSNFYGGTNTNVNIRWTPDGKTLNMSLTAWPIGSIFMSATHNTAAKVQAAVGGGTWEAYGVGRVPVGVDTSQTEFNTVGKTGGSKYMQRHNHDLRWHGPTSSRVLMSYVSGSTAVYNLSGYQSVQATTPTDNIQTGYPQDPEADYAQLTTGTSGNLQPYITCYMWRRTA